ncbi:MAG: NAD(P)/FAD-dependent oxidoreductase [Candidatus Paceibacterota bacterium]
MISKSKEYDCIVIGGGPAGMMAAIRAKKRGKRVLLIEKNKELGKKLLLTGDGRCNLSHSGKNNKELAMNFGKKGDFLLSPFSVFGTKETFDFFEKEGLVLDVENDGRVFPKSNKAKDVLQVFKKLLEGVDVLHGRSVKSFNVRSKAIKSILLDNEEKMEAKSYVLCAGGKSFSFTGSDGSGFFLAERVGHTIIPTVPGLVPMRIKQAWVKKLMGITVKDAVIIFYVDGKRMIKDRGSILFTHFGITGPMVLNASNELGKYIGKKIEIKIDLFPDKSIDDLKKDIFTLINENRNKSIKNIINIYFSEKLLLEILKLCEIDPDKKGRDIKKEEIFRICAFAKKMELVFGGLEGFDVSMATNGGVSLNEIDSKTMRSKLIDNLYFAGEIIDLIGRTGGYNLQMCWTTGYVAGNCC